MENLKASGLSHVDFHQLDVKEQTSIASYAKFIEAHFGKLDILVSHISENLIYIYFIFSFTHFLAIKLHVSI